jgi:hypothetical protein
MRYPKGSHLDRDAMLIPHQVKKTNVAARAIDKWLTTWPPLTDEQRATLAARIAPENAPR